MMQIIIPKSLASIQLIILLCTVIVTSRIEASTPAGDWFVGCFDDSALLVNFQGIGVPGDTFSVQTNFTEENALECGVKCLVANAANRYAAFSQTGVCLCPNSTYVIPFAVSNALCIQKTCDMINGTDDCDGNTYHWLVNGSKFISDVNILTTGVLSGAVPQNITVQTVPENINASITYDFGDGTSIDLVTAKIFSHVYLNAGFYKLTVNATANTGPNSPSVSDSRVMQVETRPNGIDVSIPAVIETELEYNFTGSIIEGNNMTVKGEVSIGGANMAGSSISPVFANDATLIPVGATPLELIRANIVFSSPNSGIYLLPMFKFPADGFVAGFEVFVTKVGFLRFQAFRPVCGSDNYCYNLNQCDNVCSEAVDMMNATIGSTISSAPATIPKFKLISEISLNANSTGLKYFKAKSANFAVNRGDVLAFKLDTNEGDIGYTVLSTAWEYHASPASEVFPGSELSSLTKKTGKKHLIRAHLSTTSSIRMSVKFLEPGFANVVVKATNPAFTEYSGNKYVHVQERISGFKVIVPKLLNETAYEVQKGMTLESSCVKGSNLTYEWRIYIGNTDVSYNSTSGTQEFTPSSIGIYSLFASVQNLLGQENLTIQFRVQERIADVIINGLTNGMLISPSAQPINISATVVNGTNVTLIAEYEGVTKNTTIITVSGEQHTRVIDFQAPSGGVCKVSKGKVTAKNMIPGTEVTKEFEVGILCPIKELTVTTDPFLDRSGSKPKVISGRNRDVTVTVKIKQGSFAIYSIEKGDGTNDMHNHSTKLEPEEVKFTLNYAVARVYAVNITVTNPISEEKFDFEVEVSDCPPEELEITGSPEAQNPSVVTRGLDYKVIGTVTPTANCTGSKPEIKYSIVFHSIDNNNDLDTRMNVAADNLIYTVKKQSQPAGKYKINVIQEITTPDGPQKNIKTAYLTIKETPLLAMIDSGSARQLPKKKKLKKEDTTSHYYLFDLDGKLSYDPDNKTNPLIYEWQCRSRTIVIPSNISGSECNHTDFRDYQKSLWQSRMAVNTSGFSINVTYEFLLRVRLGSRASNYTQTIVFVRGNPPTVEFECITNCDDKWNIQEKLVLRGKCPGCIDLQYIVYEWQIKYDNGTEVFSNAEMQSKKITSTGFAIQNLVINADQLKENEGYSITLKASYIDDPSTFTRITLNRRTAILPHSGSCIMLPLTGTVAQTKFQIRCQHWTCPDIPIKYEFTTKKDIPASQSVSVSSLSRTDYPIWYSGYEPRNPKSILPLGDPNAGYNLTMIVRIFNAYGSFTELPPVVVQVENVVESKEQNISSIIEGSKPKTDDAGALAQWASSVSSIINTEAASSGSVTTKAPQTEAELNSLAETRTKIIKSLAEANLEGISIANLKQVGEALGSVLAKTSEVNDDGQDASTSLLDRMADSFLNNDQGNAGAETFEQASVALMGPLSDLMQITTATSEGYLQSAKAIDNDAVLPTQASSTEPTQQPTKKQIVNKAQRTRNSAGQYMGIMDKLSKKLLQTKVSGEVPMVTKTAAFSMSLQKRTLRDLATGDIGTGSDGFGFTLPDNIFNQVAMNGTTLNNNETEVSCQGASMKKILHTWDLDNAQNSASQIESLKLVSRDYMSMNVSNLTTDITIKIKNRPEKLNTSRIILTFPHEMNIRKETIKSYDSPLLVEFGSPDNSTSNFTILIQFGFPPTLENYDAKLVITSNGIALSKSSGNVSANATASSNATINATLQGDQPLVRNSHIRVIDSKTIILWDFQNFTYGYLGNRDVYFNLFYTGAMPDPVYVPNEYTFDFLELRRPRNYTMRTFSCSCLYWSDAMNKWTDDGCKVDPYLTTFNETVCKCNHLTSFGGFYVKPNPVPPLSADMFLKGYVLFVAVAVTLCFFILGLVLARRADKKDLLKVGVCPLADNNPNHQYIYQITVWTGLRRGGSTKSNVYFILSGDNGDTDIRHLKDPERTTFQQNSSDLFIFNTESSLGDLSHIRIWHDNSGGGWYLRKVVVTDLQTDKTFQFLCNRWLAVDKDDGQIEMVAPVSGKDDLKDFNYVFMSKTRNDLGDSHLWFSLYARPPRSPFTRCQRLACCVSLLMTSMMASAMFYNSYPKPTPETANYAAGLQFTWKQVYVAVISAAITVPINIIIVTLFRSSKPSDIVDEKKKSPSRVGSKASLAESTSVKSTDSSATLNSPDSPMFNKSGEEQLLVSKTNNDAEKGMANKKAAKTKETYLFPHWCIYVGWFLTFASIVASSVMVIIYGMVFGNSKSLEWLTAILIGFVQDIVVIQPIKIFVIAVAFAAIIRSVQEERSTIEEHGKKLAEDEEWLHTHADTTVGRSVDTSTLRPPDGVKLDAMRELRFKERKMYSIVREILLYSLFVLVTLSISYALREETGFWQTNGLEKLFKLDMKENEQFNQDRFTGVLSQKDFWIWSSSTLVDALFPQAWYPISSYPQRTQSFPGKLTVNDLSHKIVNGVRLRQVRVRPASCEKNKNVKNVIEIECLAPYNMGNEDKSNFISNWTNQVSKRPTITHENQPWLYQSWDELDGYPFVAELATYFGGGYTQELFPRWDNKKNLEKLKNSRWLDRHTRAVIVEFALFNPNTNHFSMVTITFEFAATGGCIHYHSIYTFKLYRYTTGYQFFVVVCEVLFVLLLLLYLYRECKEWYHLRWKYFAQFWNLVEVTIYALSSVAIGFYVYRQKLANDLLRKLPAKKPQTFINFQFAAYIDQVFIYIVALIVFFVSIKFIKLLRFNRRMSILADTLKHSWKPLGMFSIVMGIVLTSTFAFATIVFGRQMYGYRNMLVTAATQISLLLGKFDFNEYQNTNRVIGPIFFFLYIIMVNWILLNMFLSIINDSFEVVSGNLQEQSNDYEIVDFITDQLKAWLGVGKTRREEIAQNIRWQETRVKFDAVRAFSANSKASKKSVRWCDDEVLTGLTRSSYWQDIPAIAETKDLDTDAINRTVDRFVECISLLYFDDSEIAHKMTKKVKQEISDYDYLEEEKGRKI